MNIAVSQPVILYKGTPLNNDLADRIAQDHANQNKPSQDSRKVNIAIC